MQAIWTSHFGYYETKEAFINAAKDAAENNCWLCYSLGGTFDGFRVQRSSTIPVMEPCLKLLESSADAEAGDDELKNIRDELNRHISSLINLRKRLDELLA